MVAVFQTATTYKLLGFMKQLSIIVPLSLFYFALSSQTQHDAIWLFGSPRLLPTDLQFGGSMLDFRTGEPEASYFDLDILLGPTAMICDENGELVFYTNGCKVMNAEHEIMENGDTINAGLRYNQYCDYSYPSRQGMIALPKPESTDRYGLFHTVVDPNVALLTEFRYTEIDASANNGLGRVETKDQTVFNDTISGLLSAVRHANGRDWWIVCGKHNRNAFYAVYYGPAGPQSMGSVELTDTVGTITDVLQTTFSPDGTLYAIANRHYGIRLYHFDRCSGAFSNLARINFETDTLVATGVAISPNNKFLYVSAIEKLYQFDLEASSIAASRQLIAEYDGYLVNDVPSLRTTFASLSLAPNGKIYGTAPNTSNVLHIIHQPNEPGLACEVEQHGLELPTLHSFAPPNFPHYRLWDVPGSPCDTLGIDTPTSTIAADAASTWQVFPNPASSQINIDFNQFASGVIRIYDVAGRLIADQKVTSVTQITIDVEAYAAGLYVVAFYNEKGPATSKKILIQ